MSKNLKIHFILFYFILVYLNTMIISVVDDLQPIKYIYSTFLLFIFCYFTYISYNFYRQSILSFPFFIKILIFTLLLFIYISIEQFFIYIFLYGIDGVGFLQRSGMVNYNHSYLKFSWQEKLYWHFIFSLHYPIYIFIFFKPFVNYLERSIRQIENKQNEHSK